LQLHKELEQTQKEIIYKMGEVGESRSQETGNHVKRVAEYSRILALLAGLGKKNAELLYAASPMHDIGKVAIADSILKKPGRLTPEEFHIMQKHAEIGYHILKSSKRPILRAAAIVAYRHHEKWDGTGYPNGISGKKIHIFGRITAVADVFDALGSDRVYKKGWEIDRIIQLFKDERGKHFDPDLVDLFLKNLDQFLVIRDKFKDVE
jgi:response regulator RpfG family c-di-GMP phosphodiesterase